MMNLTLLIQSSPLQKRIRKLLEEFIESAGDLIEESSSISTNDDKPADLFITDYAYLQSAGAEYIRKLKQSNPGARTMVLHHTTGKQFAEDCFSAGADYMIDTNDGIDLIPEILTDFLNKNHSR
jgi:DNA-binding NarL/FixJ family response regulator